MRLRRPDRSSSRLGIVHPLSDPGPAILEQVTSSRMVVTISTACSSPRAFDSSHYILTNFLAFWSRVAVSCGHYALSTLLNNVVPIIRTTYLNLVDEA
jgi:hypothetical protein